MRFCLILYILNLMAFNTQLSHSSELSSEQLNYYDFFINEYKDEANKKSYKYNRYEDIISGLAAWTIGNIGWFAASSDSLKIAYSVVQTIGLLNVGKGIYNVYRPHTEKEYYNLIKNQSHNHHDQENYWSEGIMRVVATEKRAKRLSLFYTSSLLAIQYAINVFIDDTPDDIENIFYFLGGVNLIVAGYSYFAIDKYEKYYFQNKEIKSYQINPTVFRINNVTTPGLQLSYMF